MKKAFISILLFYFILHFIIPGLYYWYNGYFGIYADIDAPNAVAKSFLLSTISIFSIIVLIIALPFKRDKIPPGIYDITPLYYFSIIFSVFYYFIRGGYEGLISGNMEGSILSYLTFFFNPSVYLMVILFYQKKKYNLGLLLLTYMTYVTLAGSRSGILMIIMMLLMYPAFENFDRYKRKLRNYSIVFAIVSPILFVVATRIRGVDMSLIDSDIILKAIFGRLSMVELGAIPIHYKDSGNFNIDLFYQKYGLLHQLEIIIDSLFPGNIFEQDVMPNQYYRAIFLNYSIDFVQEVYTSHNLTLPVYFYMYTGTIAGAVILFSLTILVYYLVWRRFSNNIIVSLALFSQLYGFVMYFDFVMTFSRFVTTLLSLSTVLIFIFLRKESIQYLKGYEKQII